MKTSLRDPGPGTWETLRKCLRDGWMEVRAASPHVEVVKALRGWTGTRSGSKAWERGARSAGRGPTDRVVSAGPLSSVLTSATPAVRRGALCLPLAAAAT